MKAVLLVGSKMLTLEGEPEIDREKILKTHILDVLRRSLNVSLPCTVGDGTSATPTSARSRTEDVHR